MEIAGRLKRPEHFHETDVSYASGLGRESWSRKNKRREREGKSGTQLVAR